MNALRTNLALVIALVLPACGPLAQEADLPVAQKQDLLRIGTQLLPQKPQIGNWFSIQAPWDYTACTQWGCSPSFVDLFIDRNFALTKGQSQLGTEDLLLYEALPGTNYGRLRDAYGNYLRLQGDPALGQFGFGITNVANQASAIEFNNLSWTYHPGTTDMSVLIDRGGYSYRYRCGFNSATYGMRLVCGGATWGNLRTYVQPTPNVNLALFKPAIQSSDYGPDRVASKAVDGNVNGDYGARSITHTNFEYAPYWQVDLLAPQRIGRVIINNRTDCCQDRLNSFDLLTSEDGQNWQIASSVRGSANFVIPLYMDRVARYVRVQLTSYGYLSLAEVQVFPTMNNLALDKPTSQSSTAYGGASSRAVDGIIDGNYGAGSVTHTNHEQGAWWQVDLQGVYPLDKVVLFNRTDCCTDRLSNFTVRLSQDGSNWYPIPINAPAGLVRVVDAQAQWARYVRIQLNGANPLSLAEVGVFPRN